MGRYRFDNIFSVNLQLGIIIPKFTVVINNTKFNQGVAITKNTSFGGLDLFNYIGRDVVGNWDTTTRELTITGFN